MNMEYLWSVIALIVAGYLVYKVLRPSTIYTYPSGPTGWPLIGNIFDVEIGKFHLSFAEMAKRYGDMFSVNVLGKQIVVINSSALIRKAMASEEFGETFANRPQSFLKDYTIFHRGSVLMDYGDILKKRRKLLHKMINMYGEGIKEMEATVTEELKYVIVNLEHQKTLVLEDVFSPSLINIISIMILGKRFDYQAEEVKIVFDLITCVNKMFNPSNDPVLLLFPFLRHIPLWMGSYYQRFQRLLIEFFRHYYHEPKATYQAGVSRGLVDVLLRVQDEAEKQNEQSWIDDEDASAILLDIITAGVVTTRGSLLFFFLAILHQPEAAKKIQEEVDTVVGSGRFPSLKDKAHMPYTEACMLETSRLLSFVPFSLPRSTTKDVTFQGYHLPANTMILPNMWFVHHDEVSWEKPWDFRPERFLDESGRLLPPESQNRRNLLPFGIGRRSCVGENFAKSRIFLYVTTLLQRYNFMKSNTGETLPPLDPRQFPDNAGITPDRYTVKVEPR